MPDNNKSATTSSGIGFTGLLTIVFIILKLTGTIAWKWVWVLAPLWISAILYIGIILFVLLITFLINR
jgi:hypothetical protein